MKKAEQIAREKVIDDLRKQDVKDFEMGQTQLMVGDFRERSSEIKDASVDLFFTDPLYKKDALSIWEDLGEVCQPSW